MIETRTKLNLALTSYYAESQPELPFKDVKRLESYLRRKEDGAFLANLEHFLEDYNSLSIEWAMQKLGQENPQGEVATPKSFRDAFVPLMRSGFEYEAVDTGRGVAGTFSLVNFGSTNLVGILGLVLSYYIYKNKGK